MSEREPGVWVIKLGEFIPDSERWLHAPEVSKDLDEALAWAAANPPRETDLRELEERLLHEPQIRARSAQISITQFSRDSVHPGSAPATPILTTSAKIENDLGSGLPGLRSQMGAGGFRSGDEGERIYSLRMGKGCRGLAARDGDWLRLVSLQATTSTRLPPLSPLPTHARRRHDLLGRPEDHRVQQRLRRPARQQGRVEVDRREVGPEAGRDAAGFDAQGPGAAGGGRFEQDLARRSPSSSRRAPRLSVARRWPYSSQRISSMRRDAGVGVAAQAEGGARGWARGAAGMPSPRLPSVKGQKQTVPPAAGSAPCPRRRCGCSGPRSSPSAVPERRRGAGPWDAGRSRRGRPRSPAAAPRRGCGTAGPAAGPRRRSPRGRPDPRPAGCGPRQPGSAGADRRSRPGDRSGPSSLGRRVSGSGAAPPSSGLADGARVVVGLDQDDADARLGRGCQDHGVEVVVVGVRPLLVMEVVELPDGGDAGAAHLAEGLEAEGAGRRGHRAARPGRTWPRARSRSCRRRPGRSRLGRAVRAGRRGSGRSRSREGGRGRRGGASGVRAEGAHGCDAAVVADGHLDAGLKAVPGPGQVGLEDPGRHASC